jgi:hypothetical protein
LKNSALFSSVRDEVAENKKNTNSASVNAVSGQNVIQSKSGATAILVNPKQVSTMLKSYHDILISD